MVASYVRSREACEPEDIGLLQQQWLMARWDAAGLDVPVIDAADFLQDPESHLRWLCDWLGIDFTDRMLAWPPGPRDSDGVWAPYWYDAVLASTGFAPYRPREVDLSPHDAAVAEACRPAYDALTSGASGCSSDHSRLRQVAIERYSVTYATAMRQSSSARGSAAWGRRSSSSGWASTTW